MGDPSAAVEDHPDERPAAGKSATVCQPGIIGEDGSASGDESVAPVAEAVNLSAGLFGCDPSGFSGSCCNLSVQCHGYLENPKRTLFGLIRNECFVEAAGFISEDSALDLEAGIP